jgi:glutamyl-tRNA reductase
LSKQGAVLTVMNRSPEKAVELARACGGEPRGYEHLTTELVHADVVITSTSSQRFVITDEMMHDVVRARRRRPLFLIDIAVPRDVDPRVGEMDNVFLYDVDDLQKVAAENLALRRREADAAERIVEAEVGEFEAWRRTLNLTPTIASLRERFRTIVRAELERTLPRLPSLTEREQKSLDAMAEAIVNKLLHQPLTQLKRGQSGPEAAALIAATQRLFDLTDEAPAVAVSADDANSDSVAPAGSSLATAATTRGGQRS